MSERDPLLMSECSFRGADVPEHPDRVPPPPGVTEEEWAAVPIERKATVSRTKVREEDPDA